MEFKVLRITNTNKKIAEYQCSESMYCPEDSNVYLEREFLPNLTFYRYRDNHWGDTSIDLEKFKAIRETPCGYWILVYDKEKWIPKESRKRYCYPSKSDAWYNFKCRKEKHLQILEAQVQSVKNAVQLIKEIEAAK